MPLLHRRGAASHARSRAGRPGAVCQAADSAGRAGFSRGCPAHPGLLPAADAGGSGISGPGSASGVDAGCQPDTERGSGKKLHPSGHRAGLVLACHRVGEGRAEAVAERLGPADQERPAALVLGDGVDHEAAPPGLAAGAEERGEPGEEALDVTKAGAGAFHGRQPRADEAAQIPLQGQAEDRLLGAERAIQARAVKAGGPLKVGDRRVPVALGPEHRRSRRHGDRRP